MDEVARRVSRWDGTKNLIVAKQAKAEPSAEKAIKLWQELFEDSFC